VRPAWSWFLANVFAVAVTTAAAVLGAPNLAHAAPSVDRIELSGVTAFTQPEIEESLEVSPGDALERAKVVRTAENLQELYRERGFEQVAIKSRIYRRKADEGGANAFESVLEFAVVEGKPTRVGAVRFAAEGGVDQSFVRYWRGLQDSLKSRLGLNPGDILDQEKLASGRRAVQDLMAGEEFIGARVAEVRVTTTTAPAIETLPPPSASQTGRASGIKTTADLVADTGRWVELDIRIDLGDRVSFGFRGNKTFTVGRLSGLVDEQRQLGFGKDYVGAIRGKIEEAYRAEGFARVRIEAFPMERPKQQERHVTFDIDEGPRVTIESILFDGNSVFSQDELTKQFYVRAPSSLQHGYYVEKDVQKTSELLVEWIKSKGYLGSKVVTISQLPGAPARRPGQIPDSVRLVIYLYEGDQTLVHTISFKGLNAISAVDVRRLLGIQTGQPLNLFAFSEGLEELKTAYRAKGYINVRIANEGTDSVVRYSDENRRADVSVEVEEGFQYKVGAIQIDGLVQTREIVVRRELQLKENEVLSEPLLAESEARLRRMGIFSVVTVRLVDDPDRPDAKIVRISLQEGTPGVLAGGPGFRNDFGFRLFGQAAYTNLWGLNHTLSLTANVNRRVEDYRFVEYQVQLAYLYPWFLTSDSTLRPSLTMTGNQFIQFDSTTTNAALTWEKRLFANPGLWFSMTYNVEYDNNFNVLDRSTGLRTSAENQRLRIGALTPAFRFDSRDNPLSPTRGWFGTLSYEYASPALYSQSEPYPVGYSRMQGRIDRLIALPYGMSWYLSYRAGFERSSEANIAGYARSGAIPLHKQFALGGVGSLRGFKEQQLNVQDQNLYGTLSYSNYRTQIDLPISGALKFGPFLDAANLNVDNTAPGIFLFGGLRYGVGFGFHYQTPVGPVNLDIGFNPARRDNEDPWRFYFSIGFI
jgi:outer membrane protein insertion porin family